MAQIILRFNAVSQSKQVFTLPHCVHQALLVELVRHWRPSVVKRGPPENPAQNPYLLRLYFCGVESFVRVFPRVLAAQAQAVVGQAVDVFDAQHAVLFEGVDFTVDDLGQAAVDGNGGAVLNRLGHAVANHGRTNGLVEADVHGLQDRIAQPHPAARNGRHTGFARAVRAQHFVVEGDVDVERVGCRSVVFRRLRRRVIFVVRNARMFGTFARAQPAAVDAQQLGDFVQPSHGDASLEPVVDVLRRHAAVGREVRSS